MRFFKNITILLFSSFLLFSCGETDKESEYLFDVSDEKEEKVEAVLLTPLELIAWVENNENGMISEKEINEYTFSTLFKPLEYIIAKENNVNEISEEVLDKTKLELEGLQYFTLRIGLTDGKGDVLKKNITVPAEYYAKIEYFSFAMQKDIVLVDGLDTLKCVIHHFERTFGVTPHCNFTLAFDKDEKLSKGNKTLIFDDKILGIGRIKLTIRKEDINRIPELKTT